MSKRPRLKNGRLAKESVINQRQKALKAMTEAKQKKRELENGMKNNPKTEFCQESSYVCEGNRIINLKELGDKLICSSSDCQTILSLINITSETREGLHSILKIKCHKCGMNNIVSTAKKIQSNDHQFSDVNLSAVLGTLYNGSGCMGLNKLLACLDIPVVSMNLYKRYEREIGSAIEKAAKDSCTKAAYEERQLVIDNVQKICDALPHDIATDLYSQLIALQSSPDSPVKFDAVCGEVINIIVSYDMGWSKRGNGRSYDSLNGYAAIIGFASKKVLDYTTRNRKCSLCDRNHDPTSHDCRKNFEESAKAMEADAGVELVTRSKVLQDAKLNVGVLIGDEDSSTIANINKASNKLVHKLADKNHLVKKFC